MIRPSKKTRRKARVSLVALLKGLSWSAQSSVDRLQAAACNSLPRRRRKSASQTQRYCVMAGCTQRSSTT
jgi:hypothetical protein